MDSMDNILEYHIYLAPTRPDQNGVYYGKTPILDQAEAVQKSLKNNGIISFLVCLCSDGVKRYLL